MFVRRFKTSSNAVVSSLEHTNLVEINLLQEGAGEVREGGGLRCGLHLHERERLVRSTVGSNAIPDQSSLCVGSS